MQNNWGGALTAASFPLTVTQAGVIQTGASGSSFSVKAGVDFTVGETQQPGYELVSNTCSAPQQAAPGATVVCEITSKDIPAKLTVIKDVVNNNGGAATADQFNLTAVATSGTTTKPGAEAGWTIDIAAGAYSVSEEASGPAGYLRGTGCTGTAALGGTYSCTITNDDIAPTVLLTKESSMPTAPEIPPRPRTSSSMSPRIRCLSSPT